MWLRLLDFIYPALCEICETELQNGKSLCDSCRSDLPRVIPPFCERCGEPFEGAISETFQCPNCREIDFTFEFARASLSSSEDGRFLIHRFKYLRRFYLASELAELIREIFENDQRLGKITDAILIPVPLFWWRRQVRTANQALELARQLSKISNLPLMDALKRTRHTTTQTRLPRKIRLKNLRGAFTLRPKFNDELKGKTVFLIDDVFTTGSTAEECARILKKDGAVSQVIVLTALRG